LMDLALDAGAEDVVNEGEAFVVTCEVSAFSELKTAIAAKGIETLEGEIAMIPSNTIAVDSEKARQVLNLVEALEDNDDVQKVYANFDLSDEVISELGD
jgi:transcriptional/translational regulatory protein YebC/TACO1